jgi:hypothetical protein
MNGVPLTSGTTESCGPNFVRSTVLTVMVLPKILSMAIDSFNRSSPWRNEMRRARSRRNPGMTPQHLGARDESVGVPHRNTAVICEKDRPVQIREVA